MAPAADSVFTSLREQVLVAVIRATRPEWAYDAARAVLRGGIRFIEITYSVPDAPDVMRRLAGSEAIVGAGTVLSEREARDAVAAGAMFLIAPNLSAAVAGIAKESGVMFCPGAYTTGEIIAARDAGAHVVKVYPVGVAGGPDYIKVIRDPLPGIPMLAAGGTNLANTAAFLDAGCVAVGLGAALADPALAAAGRFEEIASRARAFTALIEQRRARIANA